MKLLWLSPGKAEAEWKVSALKSFPSLGKKKEEFKGDVELSLDIILFTWFVQVRFVISLF